MMQNNKNPHNKIINKISFKLNKNNLNNLKNLFQDLISLEDITIIKKNLISLKNPNKSKQIFIQHKIKMKIHNQNNKLKI